MIAWAHRSCCVTSSTRHGSHSQQKHPAPQTAPRTTVTDPVASWVHCWLDWTPQRLHWEIDAGAEISAASPVKHVASGAFMPSVLPAPGEENSSSEHLYGGATVRFGGDASLVRPPELGGPRDAGQGVLQQRGKYFRESYSSSFMLYCQSDCSPLGGCGEALSRHEGFANHAASFLKSLISALGKVSPHVPLALQVLVTNQVDLAGPSSLCRKFSTVLFPGFRNSRSNNGG